MQHSIKHGTVMVASSATVVPHFANGTLWVIITFDPNDLYFRDVKLVTSYSCGPQDTREALELISRGTVTAERLGATLYPLEEAGAAYEALRASRILKPIVTFEPTLFP